MTVDVDITIDEKIKHTIKEPSQYKVIVLNDDHTPIDWVIDILKTIFRQSDVTAKDLTMKIHNEGSAIAGIYTYEIAEQKVHEAVTASRERGFPLALTLEAE